VRLLVDPAAMAELQDAVSFYVAHAGAALGASFVDEFDRATRTLLANPQIGAVHRKGIRQYALRRFPYHVIYQIAEDDLRIIAVAHQRRAPAYWARRK
jgi:toxin ParE1/3/4